MPPADEVAKFSMTGEELARLNNFLSIEHNVPLHVAHLAMTVGLIAQAIAATVMLESRAERIVNAQMITMLLQTMWRDVCEHEGITNDRFQSILRTVAEQTLPADMVKMIYDKRSTHHGH